MMGSEHCGSQRSTEPRKPVAAKQPCCEVYPATPSNAELTLLSSWISWYFPQTMLSPGRLFPQAVFCLAVGLLLAASSGAA